MNKKWNKRGWIIGGTVFVALLIVLVAWLFAPATQGWTKTVQPWLAEHSTFVPKEAPVPAASAKVLPPTEAPVIGDQVNNELNPVDGADLRACGSLDGNILYENISGPLVISGKDVGSTDGLNDNWLYVVDANSQFGWIPQEAVTGAIDLSVVIDQEGNCEADQLVVKPAPAIETAKLTETECSVNDTGKKILTSPLREDGTLYTWKVSDLPDDLKNCAILWEGRVNPTEEQHHVGILSTGNGVFSAEFDVNNFQYAEASFWVYDPDWDLQGVGGIKSSIGEMFVWDKRANMINNVADPYNWVILFHRIGLDTVTYETDATMGTTKPSCQDLSEPIEISVSFAPDYAGPYIASIGADRCWVAIRDLFWDKYPGAVDDYHINYLDTFKAVMFPADVTAEEVQAWIDSQK